MFFPNFALIICIVEKESESGGKLDSYEVEGGETKGEILQNLAEFQFSCYSANDMQGKAENKAAMRMNLGLSSADDQRPVVGCITRLVPQKGVHLIKHAIYRTLEMGGQFELLGSCPVPHIQREFEGIANQFQNHEHIRLILKYDESLSHAIYAASDMFIIPSIFEPCGLTQVSHLLQMLIHEF
ncbi:hypothetical protein V6Z11_D04G144600 [Gossypium hirsutum]|uniref:starch synthase n=1 Tax=Gossypium hirsutum TaxID=3635 RepID=A0A1U8IQW0_GOSHI|nr:probable starch synthase 4, chloroplastic/amyloplastic isoform X1 [Gossypium hirsutum]XP_016680454.1 probable starch synthase 4, chloroplastic/amyloplastic isoform X1 [Gossypium hirsutum]XP_040947157.1 probable starch synthase 4, chloroplastic/amyloplastic isoform X1 [Gossypium hirsutum]XP_040947158.1 probable starch synthase 4, chloroplastic/amyloplastic isoform X1 [Gossypium hirsutum]XP_040947159.1 probable starch synthase 4, chloroplastic/amyloplastic isoform X1 [Gossypium hirsutum]XP_04